MTNISLAIVSRDGRYLLLKRSETDASNPDRWALPGGHCEKGESIVEGLIRELNEETILETIPLYCKLIKQTRHENKMLNFFWVSKTKQNVALLDGEHSCFVWCPAKAVSSYNPLPYITDLITSIELEKTNE